jgi:tRNA-specific 2-thiouridylase
MKKVVLGMSGGVDSSVAAFLLKKKGYDVIGIFMKNWEECNQKDFEDVAFVCEKLKIPYYSINLSEEYKEKVFKYFLEEYKKGNTPNPDILCNKEIKFKIFLEKAKKLNADFLATGHYAKNALINKKHHLLKALDSSKDQTYFLYTLNQKTLKNVLFPLGDLKKEEVRKIAKRENFVNADKKDSTGICFIGKKNFRPFLSKYLPYKKGEIKTLKGETVGEHMGAHLYTIGQRKGLNIGGKGEAWFLVKKEIEKNILYVVQGKNHKALFSKCLTAGNVNFITNNFKIPIKCKAKVRYRQEDQKCVIKKFENGKISVEFMHPQRAITKSQAIVFYDKNICLGGGIIEDTNFQ